ncbi:CTD small phosphatase-like protein isoform X4 [Marmota monax]|uniref:CTD small phosphatase-like protein isoform X4 n=1 Tax=Marmota monax TaxID=9995 RepID=UPI0026EDCDA9|nr:CTD small phosphatase-like protein isoform X4 [Marmota monax]
MDGPAIITQVTNPKEDEGRAPGAGEKASQCNVSLKKQRNRSILSSFFCCFRDYNVEAPPSSSPSVLPPLVEENGGLQKPPAKYLLPEVTVLDYGKKCVVIDLDETLVHSSFKAVPPFVVEARQVIQRLDQDAGNVTTFRTEKNVLSCLCLFQGTKACFNILLLNCFFQLSKHWSSLLVMLILLFRLKSMELYISRQQENHQVPTDSEFLGKGVLFQYQLLQTDLVTPAFSSGSLANTQP